MEKRSYERQLMRPLLNVAKDVPLRLADIACHQGKIYPLCYVELKSSNPRAQDVFISAGIHGREIGGIYAALRFMEKSIKNPDPDFNFRIFPCINPTGFEDNTRENRNKADLNRDYARIGSQAETRIIKLLLTQQAKRYAFTIDMHEDSVDDPVSDIMGEGEFPAEKNPTDFYMYEISPPGSRQGRGVIQSLERQGVAISRQKRIYAEKNNEGIVWTPKPKSSSDANHSTLFGYLQKYTEHSYITETMTTWSLERRVDVQLLALDALLGEFMKK